MTGAEMVAAGLQRMIDEAVDRVANGHAADASLRLTEAGKLLGFDASYVGKLCKTGQLDSTGRGKARRVPMSAIVAFKTRTRNTRRKVQDFSSLIGGTAASSGAHR
jgi:hypothetical protein